MHLLVVIFLEEFNQIAGNLRCTLFITLLRMGSDERRSILRRRLFRHGRSGTPTSSPEEADFSDEEPIDDHAAEQMMLQAVRLANPDMDDAALIESI